MTSIPSAAPGHVAFATDRPRITVTCRLGGRSATNAGGVGGWRDVERPGRGAAIEWSGTPALTLVIPVLLDGLADRRSVEAEISRVYELGRPPATAPRGTPPPVVRVGGMVPHGGRPWVLTGIDEGDAVWDDSRRVRWSATLTFTAHEPLDVVRVTPRKASAPATRIHVVRRGESLAGIAVKVMGARSSTEVTRDVVALLKLNGMRDPKALRVGQRLKVPR